MSRYIFFTLAVVVIASLFHFGVSPALMGQSDLSSYSTLGRDIFVVAHRGDEQKFPENSADAFVSGADHGADFVEMDIRRTQDGAFVVHHDDWTGRSVDCPQGNVAIAQATLAYLKQCRYKDLPEQRGQILTLAETLQLLKPSAVGLVLDVKPVIKEHEMEALAEELLALDPQGSCVKGQDPGATFGCFSKIIIYVNDVDAHNRLWRMAKGLESSQARYRSLAAMKYLKIVYTAKNALDRPERFLDNDGIAFNMQASEEQDIRVLRAQYPNKVLAVWTLAETKEFEKARALGMNGVIVSHLHDYIGYETRLAGAESAH